jgi:hypothetical protein
MTGKQRHPGIDGRARDKDGEIRHKNGNTRVDTLRGIYGDGFAPDVRGDMHLDTLLDRTGANSLRDYLKNRGR